MGYAATGLALTMVGEALAAVDGTVALGNEGHRGGSAAGCAGGLEGLTGRVGAVGLAGSAAFLAAGGLILEALLGVEFLLASREHKFGTAVTAHQSLVFVHGWVPPIFYQFVHPADLVFDPTLAGWRVCSSHWRPTRPLSHYNGRSYI